MTDDKETGRETRIDWTRLFDRDSTEAAMAEIAQVLGAPSADARAVAEPRDAGPAVATGTEWSELSREAMEAWKVARESLSGMEASLEARSRELGLLQLIGRRAAEAGNSAELFSMAAEVLQEASDLELILVTHRLRGSTEARAFLARPVEHGVVAALAGEAARYMEWEPADSSGIDSGPMPAYDRDRWPLTRFREQDLVMLPVMRRGRPVACLALLHSTLPDEAGLRVLYSAANQLSLQIDRILTVQEAEESRFRSILDSMPQAVFLTDGTLRVMQANPAAVRLQDRLGLHDAGGRIDAIGKVDLDELASGVRSGRTDKAFAEIRLDGGEVFDLTLCPFRPFRGMTEGLLLILADVTESRRLQEQLTHAEKISAIGQMISGVAHELNNPLASIMGYAQLLRSTSTEAKLSERLGVLYQESRRCQKIVQKLLSFVRNHEPERRALSLNEIASSVIGLMKYQLRVDGIEVATEFDMSISPVVGDGHQLQQALLNLITNAQHAIRESGGKGSIAIRTYTGQDDRIVLEVEDSGPGISADLQSRIFDPFFTTKGPGEGTGLGLSLVYGTVRAHRGEIRVRSGSLGGACFVIELPANWEPGASAEETGAGTAPAAEPARILVVDDESTLATLLRDTLASDGHEVAVSSGGEPALERLAEGPFDLVIMDYRMPDMDGRTLQAEIRERFADLRPAMILTSGDTVSREPDRLAGETGMPLLHKPFDLDDLRRTVGEQLRERRRERR